eukprot:TRINITY_DN22563_c0_g1_i1.p1 TRINITY_DN22563_c0_g1~~TRINITY_DN22563_c0_g1_i1.p1  ORF type:complete len:443 (-),score=123.09 TRINITY_DN22563_c0_g1_i1:135-1463(-)
MSMLSCFQALILVVLPCVVIIDRASAADTLKGLVECMNNQECLGANRECSHVDRALTGKCVCKTGHQVTGEGFSCIKKAVHKMRSQHVTCETDEDCDRNEVCMSWQYDPTLEYARKLRNQLSSGGDQPEKHQFCIDAWIIYNNHLEDLDEPRTGGGLKSNKRNLEGEEYFYSGRRPPRVQQQYIGFAEDLMLILFLVCILATLVTVHRAACYRQIQDARRNTPLRHILPIPEDRPPPYPHGQSESVDGLSAIVLSSAGPKPLTESPPPTYEEALDRNTVRLTELEERVGQAQQEEGERRDDTSENTQDNREPTGFTVESLEDNSESEVSPSGNINIQDDPSASIEPVGESQSQQTVQHFQGLLATATDIINIDEVTEVNDAVLENMYINNKESVDSFVVDIEIDSKKDNQKERDKLIDDSDGVHPAGDTTFLSDETDQVVNV